MVYFSGIQDTFVAIAVPVCACVHVWARVLLAVYACEAMFVH